MNRGYESPDLDYKETFDNSTGAWMEVAKDVYGMANYGGGDIIFGVKDGSFEPLGMEETFHLDSEVWTQKFSKWITGNIHLSYFEFVKMLRGKEKNFLFFE